MEHLTNEKRLLKIFTKRNRRQTDWDNVFELLQEDEQVKSLNIPSAAFRALAQIVVRIEHEEFGYSLTKADCIRFVETLVEARGQQTDKTAPNVLLHAVEKSLVPLYPKETHPHILDVVEAHITLWTPPTKYVPTTSK